MAEARTEILSTIGVGSGINTTKLIDALIEADTAAERESIESGEEQNKAKISALSTVKSYLNEFNSIIDNFRSASGSGFVGSSSNTTIATFTANNKTAASETQSSLIVSTLATQHTLTGPSYSSLSATVGSGNLTIDFGTWSADPTSGGGQTHTSNGQTQISITTSSSTTLTSLRDMINAAATDSDNDGKKDVLASIIYDGTNYMLMLKSESGAANEMKVSATSNLASTVSGVSYNYNATTSNMTQRVSGVNSAFTLDGISMTRDSNEIQDAISGFTLSLLKTSDSAISIKSSVDLTGIKSTIEDYVLTYNEILENFKLLSVDDTTGAGEDGPLNGDSTMRSIMSSLRNLTSTAISGYESGPYYLSNLGVKTNRDGTLSFKPAQLTEQFEYNAETVRAFFEDQLTTDNENIVVKTYDFANTKAGTYAFSTDGSTHTIGGESASKSGTEYTVSSGNPTGIVLDVSSGTTSGNVFYGKSFLTLVQDKLKNYLEFNNIIDQRISNSNNTLDELSDKKMRLDSRIESLYRRYQKQYAAMESTIAGIAETGDMMTAMLDTKD